MDRDGAFKEFVVKHELFSKLMQYPPFSINPDIRDAVIDQLEKNGNPDDIEDPAKIAGFYNNIMETFAQDFEEASLWMGRHPLDRSEAARAALELEGIPNWEIELRLPFS